MTIPAIIQLLGTWISHSVQACFVSVVLGWFVVDTLHPLNGKDMNMHLFWPLQGFKFLQPELE